MHPAHGLHPRGDAQHLVDRPQMGLDGALGDVELARDDLVGLALQQPAQHRALALAQLGQAAGPGRARRAVSQRGLAQRHRRQVDAMRQHDAQRIDGDHRVGALGDVAGRTGLDGLHDQGRVFVGRDHHDGRAVDGGLDRGQRVQPRRAGQVHVQQHQVQRRRLRGHRQGLGQVAGVEGLSVGRQAQQQGLQALTVQRVVVDNQDVHGAGLGG